MEGSQLSAAHSSDEISISPLFGVEGYMLQNGSSCPHGLVSAVEDLGISRNQLGCPAIPEWLFVQGPNIL